MFIISKIIGLLIDPIMWIIALLAIGYLSRRRWLRTKLYISALVLFLVFSNPFLMKNVTYRYQSNAIELAEGERYDAAILLGGLAGLDEDRNKGIFNQAADRFIQTARLYETGKVKKILITGGDSRIFKKIEYKEAEFIASNLMDLQIPSRDILIEGKARNTIENARFSKRILDSLDSKGPFLLVTSALHMPRAVKAFRKEGIDIRPYPCNFGVTGSDTDFNADNFVPKGYVLSAWNSLFREWMGLLQLSITRGK